MGRQDKNRDGGTIRQSIRTYILALLLVFFSPFLFAQDESLQYYPAEQILRFRGLDDISSPTSVEDGRAVDLLNVKFTPTYGLYKREGYKRILDFPDDAANDEWPAVTGLWYAKFSNGTERQVAVIGNKLFYNDGVHWERIPTPGGITLTAGQNNQFVWTTALDHIIGTNDVNVPIQINSTPYGYTMAFTGLSDTLTKAKGVTWFRNYLIWTNTVEAGIERPTRWRWSNLGTIYSYTDDNYIDIDALGGQEINALVILYDNVYVFLTDSIYKASLVGGDEVWNISKVIPNVGCIAKNSVQVVDMPNGGKAVIFLAKDKHFYIFDGQTIADLSGLRVNTSAFIASRLPYVVSGYDGADYYAAVTNSSGSTNNLVLDFNTDIGEWTKLDQVDANAMTKVVDSSGIEQIYFGNYKSYIYQLINTDIVNDIDGLTGQVDLILNNYYTLQSQTVSGLTMLIPTVTGLTVSGLKGAIIRITAGTGQGEEKIIMDNTITGIVVDSAFTATLDSTSLFSVGDINSYFTANWEDCATAPRLKHFGEVYLWIKEVTGNNVVSYAVDFGSTLESQNLATTSSGALWDSGIWGTALWGGESNSTVLKRIKLAAEGRHLQIKFTENDIDEDMQYYGYSIIYWPMDVN